MGNDTHKSKLSAEFNAPAETNSDSSIYNQLKSLPENDFSPLEYVPIPSFICKFDKETHHQLLSCNLPFRTLFNLHDDVSNTVEKMLPISFANTICKRYENSDIKKEVIRVNENISLNKSICELDITLSPIFDNESEIAYISGTINNVKEIKKLDSNTEDNFKHLQTAFNNVPGVVSILNRKGMHVYANKEYLQFFNKSYDELNKLEGDFLFSNYNSSFKKQFLTALQGTESAFDIDLPNSNAKWKKIRFSISPYRLNDDNINGVIVTGHELTNSNTNESADCKYKQLDQLTKLLDRKSCIVHIDELVEKYERKDAEFSILAIDLKDFKTINQNIGFEKCDELLEKVARRIESVIRQQDIVFRFGGNEYICVLDNCTFETMKVTARRIRNAIEQPYAIHDKKINLSAHYGSAAYPSEGKTSNELISALTSTLAYAKENNPNTLIEFDGLLHEKLERRSTIFNELHTALEKQEFHLAYQPIIDLSTLKPIGAEALIRWKNDVLGNVPPNDFIPIAEESDLIDDIGEFVMRKACKDLADIQKRVGNDKFTMAVNTSARQFKRHKLLGIVKNCIEASGIAPGCLELEVTERQLIHDFDGAVSELNDIVEMGVKLSIDDFGNGYSSFSTLRSIPFDTLKIDRLFIQDITSRSGAFTLVKTITSMTRVLGLNSVAEGIETRAQLNLLRNFAGCKYAQGFYFSRPIPLNDLVQYVEKADSSEDAPLA